MVKKFIGRKKQEPTNDLERRLLETVQRYQLVYKATNDVLYDFDLRQGKILWNDALYTQYGYSKKEKADQLEWWASHIHPDDALRLEDELSKWFTGGQDTWQAEYRFLRADGSYSDVRDRGVLQRAPDGEPIRIIGSLLDITKQKELDRAKDEFISLVSHQMRTPLTAIRIHSELLTSGLIGQLGGETTAHVERITSASVRLIKLVDDILNISRAELGHIVPKFESTGVNEFIQSHIDEVAPLAAEKKANIRFTPNLDIKKVTLDMTIFGHIIHNLLTNAIRYSEPRKGVIEVSFDRNRSGYLLAVKDNGIGIPETALPHIFNRFFRADNALNSKEQGTGLGLYLVKVMAETVGYDVWAEANKGKGTTFFVRMPVRT